MQRLAVFVFLFFMLGSMQRKFYPEPLSQKKMASILVDLELAKAMVEYYTDDEATASQLLNENICLIYRAYDVTPDIFQKNYQYYLTQLGDMKKIYDQVIKQLEELEANI